MAWSPSHCAAVPEAGTPAVTGLTNAELRAAAVAVTGPLTDAALRAAPIGVTGPLTDAALRAAPVPVSGPLTDAALRAAPVVVAGPLTDVELRAVPVAVSGPLTDVALRAAPVPVSVAALPLPAGAATDATLVALSALIGTLSDKPAANSVLDRLYQLGVKLDVAAKVAAQKALPVRVAPRFSLLHR